MNCCSKEKKNTNFIEFLEKRKGKKYNYLIVAILLKSHYSRGRNSVKVLTFIFLKSIRK